MSVTQARLLKVTLGISDPTAIVARNRTLPASNFSSPCESVEKMRGSGTIPGARLGQPSVAARRGCEGKWRT